MKEERFYPYLWFPGRAPYLLKDDDFCNIFPAFHVGEMQKALRSLGVVGGTLGLTASRQLVIFFDLEARSMFQDAMKKMMVCRSAIPVVLFLIMNYSKIRDGKVQ